MNDGNGERCSIYTRVFGRYRQCNAKPHVHSQYICSDCSEKHYAFACMKHSRAFTRLFDVTGLHEVNLPECSHPDAVFKEAECILPTSELTVDKITSVPVHEEVAQR